MKKRTFLICLLVLFAAQLAALILFASQNTDDMQNTVLVNEALQSVRADWDAIENHKNRTSLNYVVLDEDGTLLYRTKPGLSENLNQAISHRDTILDIRDGGSLVGKIIISNDSAFLFEQKKRTLIITLSVMLLVQCGICIGYFIYLNQALIQPFQKLEGFAERVAGGNLDIPLEMDRQNLFGAFTESFDIMRAELRAARQAEAEANESKKELVAKLSHDIKTPVASIKAVSEVGAALADDERLRNHYTQIIRKADQINALVTNLFTATLEELKQLSVAPEDMESGKLAYMLENSDYLHRARIPEIPGCIVFADPLRLQQVFDNIFANSYKYAGTDIAVTVHRDSRRLVVSVEDFGGGVGEEELPLLKEKFKRGSNAQNLEGAGLGLYISDYFMKEMKGALLVENGRSGLRTTVLISLSGRFAGRCDA